MHIISAHKGSFEMHTHVNGLAAHGSDPRKGISAIEIATPMIAKLFELAQYYSQQAPADCPFDPPYTTISVGKVQGGAARNIIAQDCAFDWEVRPINTQDGPAILAEMAVFEAELQQRYGPLANITTICEAEVPPLSHTPDNQAVAFLTQLTGQNTVECVSFGTDAGHFDAAHIPTAVFGPGDISRAHKADEYITEAEISQCLWFFEKLGQSLTD